MHTTLDTLCSQFTLTPRQKEFCAALSEIIAKPEFDLLDAARLSLTKQGEQLHLVLPHRTDPDLKILVVLSNASLKSLQVWNFEFVDLFQAFSGQDSPEAWLLKVNNLLLGRVCLEIWIQNRSILQTRTNHYSTDLGKWIMGDTVQSRRGFLGIRISRSGSGKPLPPDCLHEQKHVVFCSTHAIPKFAAA